MAMNVRERTLLVRPISHDTFGFGQLGGWAPLVLVKAVPGATGIWMTDSLIPVINRMHMNGDGSAHLALERRCSTGAARLCRAGQRRSS